MQSPIFPALVRLRQAMPEAIWFSRIVCELWDLKRPLINKTENDGGINQSPTLGPHKHAAHTHTHTPTLM